MNRKEMRQKVGLWVGMVGFLVVFFFPGFGLSSESQRVLAMAFLMVCWWVAEALPMAVVALLPLVFFPLLGILPIDQVALAYANPIIFLFLGGFMISLAIEKWELHRRIALSVIRLTGSSGNRIILGFILSTGLLSMWLSNTATTMMMFPIASSVIAVLHGHHQGHPGLRHFSLSLMLVIAYAANFGGVATLIGTPPNVAFAAFVFKHYEREIPFSDWLMVGFPIAITLLLILYWILTGLLYPNKIEKSADAAQWVQNELKKLGPMKKAQKRTAIIFLLTALGWMAKGFVNKYLPFPMDDTMVALAGGFALFFTPSGEKRDGLVEPLLSWSDTDKLAWGILLLFGGGMVLANALEKSGLMTELGLVIAQFACNRISLLLLVIILVSIFLSEFMSNVAQVIVLAPVISAMADAMAVNPFVLGIPMTIAASCSSMMPMGTPPNAIVFSSGHVPLIDMVRAGLILNLAAVVVIFLIAQWWIPVIFSI